MCSAPTSVSRSLIESTNFESFAGVDLRLREVVGAEVAAEGVCALHVALVVHVDRHAGVGHVSDGRLPVVEGLSEDARFFRGCEHRLHAGSVELAHEEVRDDRPRIDHDLRPRGDDAPVAIDAHHGQVREDRLDRHEASGEVDPNDERRGVRRVRHRGAASRRDGLLSARGQSQHRDQDPQALHALSTPPPS